MDDSHELRNPFLRSNPYFVPQRFYSQERNNNQSNNLVLQARHQNYLQEEKAVCRPRVGIGLNSHQRQNQHVQYQNNERKQVKLRKKHIGHLQNPFYRRHLMDGKEHCHVEHRYYPEDLQSRHDRLFSSSKVASPMKNYESASKIPSVKHLEVESSPAPKYLLEELKIKLKSQTCLDNAAVSYSKSSISQAPMTLSKSLKQIEQNGLPAEAITFKGKVYYLQQVTPYP